MPHRRELLELLDDYAPHDTREERHVAAMKEFISQTADCFLRSNLAGHVTASAWIVSLDRQMILLNHHKKFGIWMQFGGHADGGSDVRAVATREAVEETGLNGLRLLDAKPYDVGVRHVPKQDDVPEHRHYDVCFLLEADPRERLVVSSESHELRWVPRDEVLALLESNDHTRLMWEKTSRLDKLSERNGGCRLMSGIESSGWRSIG